MLPVLQESKLGIVVGCCAFLGSSFAINRVFWMVVNALPAGVPADAHVVHCGAAAARAPSCAARVIVPYILNACPNQKIPKSIMNIKGRTAAASAISAPRVSAASLRRMVRVELRILGHDSEFPENSIKHHGERQRHAVRNLQRLRVVERDLSSRQPECHQRDQDVPDIANRLTRPPFVDH